MSFSVSLVSLVFRSRFECLLNYESMILKTICIQSESLLQTYLMTMEILVDCVQGFDFFQPKTSKTQVDGARYHKIGKVVYILDTSSLFGKICP